MNKIFTLLLLVTLGTSAMAEEKLAFSFFDKLFKSQKEKIIDDTSLIPENLNTDHKTSLAFK